MDLPTTEAELEQLYQENKCHKKECWDGIYYCFSFVKGEHIFIVLKEESEIAWYKRKLLDTMIVDVIARSADVSYYDHEIEKSEFLQFSDRKTSSCNKMCSFQTEYDTYMVLLNVLNMKE